MKRALIAILPTALVFRSVDSQEVKLQPSPAAVSLVAEVLSCTRHRPYSRPKQKQRPSRQKAAWRNPARSSSHTSTLKEQQSLRKLDIGCELVRLDFGCRGCFFLFYYFLSHILLVVISFFSNYKNDVDHAASPVVWRWRWPAWITSTNDWSLRIGRN